MLVSPRNHPTIFSTNNNSKNNQENSKQKNCCFIHSIILLAEAKNTVNLFEF